MKNVNDTVGPLKSLDEWEDDLKARYPEEDGDVPKAKKEYRNYDDPARDTVREFYRLNHEHQCLEFARAKRAEYATLDRRTMGIWETAEYLNTLVDDSDPDTDLSQIEHLLQTSEAIRADGHPDWFVLTGLIHDLGKIMCLWGSRNGPWSAIRFRWDARSRTRSCTRNFSRQIRTVKCRNCEPIAASMRRVTDLAKSRCRGGMMSTCIS